MAAAEDYIRSELECGICMDELKQPKYFGPCSHTFCKECIVQYRQSSERHDVITCPKCRIERRVPDAGIDGFKDNFQIANIIDALRKSERRSSIGGATVVEAKCIICSGVAVNFCKACDYRLCRGCKYRHTVDHKTRHHAIYALCPSHNFAKLFYCSVCKQAICSACKVSAHNKGGHDVIDIGLLFEDLRVRIQNMAAKLEGMGGASDKKVKSLFDEAGAVLSDNIAFDPDTLRKWSSFHQELTSFFNSAENKDRPRPGNATAAGGRGPTGAGVDNHDPETATTPEEHRALIQRLDGMLTSYDLSELKQAVRSGGVLTTLALAGCHNFRTLSSVLECHGRIGVGRYDYLIEQFESLRLTKCYDVIKQQQTSGNADSAACRPDQAEVAMSPRHPPPKMTYNSLEKIQDIAFPSLCPCRAVMKIKNFPDGRVVVLGESGNSGDADTIYCNQPHDISVLRGGVFPAWDLSVTASGKLAVARGGKPPIRIYDLDQDTGAYHDVNVKHKGKDVEELVLIETDESENMFVVNLSDEAYLMAVSQEGRVIHSLRISRPVGGMAYCRRTKTLYMAAAHMIRRFKWEGGVLREVSSSAHGQSNVSCFDIFIGAGGERYVAGKVGLCDSELGDVHVYQGDETDQGLRLRELQWQDSKRRQTHSYPCICTVGDSLWLGYDQHAEMFNLQ